MFSVTEKRKIAEAIEKTILDLKHPEMPTEKPKFSIHIDGKENWSWADIKPNWMFDDGKEMRVNPFNEIARQLMPNKKGECEYD